MKNRCRIIETYRKADCERRLNLFLECPAMRKDFIEIETREESTKSGNGVWPRFWQKFLSI